ncbi:MAG: flagellin N-terminal helical domain-containing protein [Planctomycetota bacterium]
MYEFKSVTDVSNNAYVVDARTSGINSSTGAPDNDEVVASLKELSDGNISTVRQSIQQASTAVGTAQQLKKNLEEISTRLEQMEELAKKAGSPDTSVNQSEQMQKNFQELGDQINTITNSTEHNYNKIFTAEGKSISLVIGDGSKIDIISKDMTFNTEGLDLVNDANGAITAVAKAIKEMSSYKEDFDRKASILHEASEKIEQKLASAMGVESDDFKSITSGDFQQFLSELASDSSKTLNAQANVESERGLKLLEE